MYGSRQYLYDLAISIIVRNQDEEYERLEMDRGTREARNDVQKKEEEDEEYEIKTTL